jgi:anti-sigma factor RsiW
LEPREIEEYMLDRVSARRKSAVQRHLADCARCAGVVSEANANEGFLGEIRKAGDLAELRRKIASHTAARTAETLGLTQVPSRE